MGVHGVGYAIVGCTTVAPPWHTHRRVWFQLPLLNTAVPKGLPAQYCGTEGSTAWE